MKLFLCALPLFLWSLSAEPHSVVLPYLTEAICAWETRRSPNPTDEVSNKGAVGICQIKPEVILYLAKREGYKGTNKTLYMALFDEVESRRWAAKLLLFIAKKHRTHKVWKLAQWYNAGPWRSLRRTGEAADYARHIVAIRNRFIKLYGKNFQDFPAESALISQLMRPLADDYFFQLVAQLNRRKDD